MYRLFLVLISLMIACSMPASAGDREDLNALLDNFLSMQEGAIYQNHNRFWADDLVYTGSAGTRTNKKAILTSITTSEAAGESGEASPKYHAEDVDIRLYGTTAIVAFRLVAKTEGVEKANEYYNTGTFLKRSGIWQAVAWQATKIPAK